VFFYTNIEKYAYSTDLRLFESEIILPPSIATPETKMLHRPLPIFVGEKILLTSLCLLKKLASLPVTSLSRPAQYSRHADASLWAP
jgi:hypothetical protein